MWAAYGNFVVPLQLGAKDMAFPWLNAFAFLADTASRRWSCCWVTFVNPAEAGWTSYPPLSTLFSGDGQTLWALGAHLLGIVIDSGLDQLHRHHSQHAPARDDASGACRCSVGQCLATSIIAVMATPFLAGALTLLLLDRMAGTTFFRRRRRRGTSCYGRTSSGFTAIPAVYIMVLPGMGVLSEVLSIHSRKPVFGYRMVGLSSMGDCHRGLHRLGASHVHQLAAGTAHSFYDHHHDHRRAHRHQDVQLAGHHLGRQDPLHQRHALRAWLYVNVSSSAASPASCWRRFPLISTFTIPILSSVTFHFVLFGGSVFAIYAALYHWFPKITGRMMDETTGPDPFCLHLFWLSLITFLPDAHRRHAGHAAARRRLRPEPSPTWNRLISIRRLRLGILDLSSSFTMPSVRSYFHGPIAGANPWRALTLEWATTSPPPPTNFARRSRSHTKILTAMAPKRPTAYIEAIDMAFDRSAIQRRPGAD